MARERLAALIAELEAAGAETTSLRDALEELEAIENPSALGRLTGQVKRLARRHWSHVLGELQESREMMAMLRRRLSGAETLEPEEADRIRAQMLDLLRVLPAGFIAAVNWSLPLPGTSFVTPWLLARLGLMPSRWREAHVLATLRREQQRLEEAGQPERAAAMGQVAGDIECEADVREAALAAAALLTHWDANDNGRWDRQELEAYQTELLGLREQARRHAEDLRWFASIHGQVFGPFALATLVEAPTAHTLLVCFDGRSGWVQLAHLRGEPLPQAPD